MQIWEQIEGSAIYRNLINGNEKTEISLSDGWTPSPEGYVNYSIRKRSIRHPYLYVRNDSLFGPECEQRPSENGRVLYLINGCWYEEDEMKLPFGWKRGLDYGNRRFYFNEYRKEFSYKLPGACEIPLGGKYSYEEQNAINEEQNAINEELKARNEGLKARIDGIQYHLHNREVVGRLENVIAYSLMKKWEITESDFYEHIGSFDTNFPRSIYSLNLYQLLNLPGFADIPCDLEANLRAFSQIFYDWKKDSHRVVHQQVLQPEELTKIMNEIFEKLSLDNNKPNPFYDSILWVRDHEIEYLKDGDIDRLRRSFNKFPFEFIFPSLDG